MYFFSFLFFSLFLLIKHTNFFKFSFSFYFSSNTTHHHFNFSFLPLIFLLNKHFPHFSSKQTFPSKQIEPWLDGYLETLNLGICLFYVSPMLGIVKEIEEKSYYFFTFDVTDKGFSSVSKISLRC